MGFPQNTLKEWLISRAERVYFDDYSPYDGEERPYKKLLSEIKGCRADKLILHFLRRKGETAWVSGELGEDQFGLSPMSINFVIGLLCSKEVSFGSQEPDFVEIEKHLKAYMESERSKIVGFDAHSEMKGRMLFTSYFVENFQYLESILRRYKGHDELLEQEVEFNSEELKEFLLHYFDSIGVDKNSYDLSYHLESFYGGLDVLETLSKELIECDLQEVVDMPSLKEAVEEFDTAREEYCQISKGNFEHERETFIERSELSNKKMEKILERLEVSIPSEMSYEDPYMLNPVEKHPIVRFEDKLYFLQVRELLKSINDTLFYDLAFDEDGEKRGEFLDEWGNYLEIWTRDELERVADNTGRSLLPNNDQDLGEVDVAAEIDGKLILVECKTKEFKLKSRKGSDDSLKEDLEMGIGRASDQLDKLAKKIQRGDVDRLVGEEKEISVVNYAKEDIRQIVVLGSPYDQIGVGEFTNVLDRQIFPWVVDIYALQLITRFSSQQEFLDYVRHRIQMINSKGSIRAFEELDLFGSYRFGHIGDLIEVNGGIDILLGENMMFQFTNGARHITQKLDYRKELERVVKET